jgi:hypothetical protein
LRGSSHGSSSTTSTTSRVREPWHVARLITRLVVDYFTYVARSVALARRAACRVTHRQLLRLTQARRRLLRLRRASGCLGTLRGSSRGSSPTTSPRAGSSSTTSPTPCVRVPRHVARLVTRLVVDYFDYAARPGALACRTARHPARRRLLRLRRASGCLGMSRGSSHGSSSTTSPRAGSSTTTSPTPRVRVPRHIAWLITRLVVDYLASRRLVVDYFDYATHPGASARRAAHHVTRRAARRRVLCLHRASGCLGTSRGSSRRSSLTTSPPPLAVDNFASAARPVASARRAARHVARRRLLHAPRLRLATTLALLQPHRASRLLVSRQH